LVPVYEELMTDGGIGRLRRLLRDSLVKSVSERLRGWIAKRLCDISRRLVEPLEAARRRSGEDLLPDVSRCLEVVFQQIQSLQGRTNFFDSPASDLRNDLQRQFNLRFSPGEYNDARPLADVQQHFPGDARALEDHLDDQLRLTVVPRLFREAGAALQDLPQDLPLVGHNGVAQAWQAFAQHDAKHPAEWKGPVAPTFLDPVLFTLPQLREADHLNGKRYRALMEEKVRVCAQQVMHVLRTRLIARLKELERGLNDLTKIEADGQASPGQSAAKVDYDDLMNKLRTLCPST
jgi:hypothetical protein